ncbi:MAG TPA: PilN domain-containing protein [Candidatus Limnocylindrales bacterium]|nr:PilN domain-containing protein [Candidatus Limnocylindrales bacterium]
MNNINLLDYKSKINVSKHRNNSSLRIIAVGLLFLVSAASIVLFILISLSPLPELSKQKKAAEFNLSLSSSEIVKLGLVNDRIQIINNILKNRPQYDQFLNNLQSLLPSGVAIDSFKVEGDILNVTVSSMSLFNINQFLDTIQNADKSQNGFSNILLSNLKIDKSDNSFSVTLMISI